MVRKPRDFGGLILTTHQRDYTLKFKTADELVSWYHHLQQVVSKEIQVESYNQRKKELEEKVSNLNKYTQYKKIVQDIEDKLVEIKRLCTAKRRFQKENATDEDITEYIESLKENSNIP